MMRSRLLIPLLAALLCPGQPLAAAEMGLQATLKQMADLLAAQQKQLDQQAKELEEQRELIRQLQGDQPAEKAPAVAQKTETPLVPPPDKTEASTDAPAETKVAVAADTSGDGDDQTAQDQAKEALAKQATKQPDSLEKQIADLQSAMDDPANTLYDADFIGAWYLPGTTAAMKVGGYVNLSIVDNFDPMLIPDRFIVGSIPPDDQMVTGAIQGTSVSANQTRLNVEYREQTSLGEVRAYVEGDFRGDGDTFRLRHAFGQFRAFLAGKTWSTFMDVDARPEEVDIEGMNGEVLLRHSQVRWSPKFGENYQLKLALEDPQAAIINGETRRGRFDFVGSSTWMPLGPLGRWNYRVGLILRDLKADGAVSGPDDDIVTPASDSTTGWGITTGGRQPVTWWGDGNDYFIWQLTYGEGISQYINDPQSVSAGDAVFDPKGKLRAIPIFAGYLTYQHIWPLNWHRLKSWPGIMRSNFSIGYVNMDTFGFQDDDNYSETVRASVNVIYNPTKNVRLGVELLWGRRKNADESKGSATQLQVSARYTF
ncbi:DcaP family trimeric outer membrane transporter [Pseudomonadota bacterium]